MKLTLRADQKEMRKRFKDFADKEIKPWAAELDQKEEFPTRNLIRMAREGFMGIPIPEEWGGAGADFLTYIFAVEEFSRACASTGVILSVHTSLGTYAILNYGTDEQKEKYVRKLATGELLGAYALTEASAGSDAGSLKTTAVLDGDYYILNGSKVFITSGGQADIYIVFATVDKTRGAKGITAFIVEKTDVGLIIGAKERKMGLNASATTEIIFDSCRVPVANRLGEEGQGFKIAMSLLDSGRIGIGAQGLGIARAALDASVEYLRERKEFGSPVSQFQFQGISFKLADMATNIEAARLLVYQSAYLKGKGLPCGKAASMAKCFATDTAMNTSAEAVQVFGEYGYSKDYPVERLMRDAKATQIYEGTNQIQRLVISKHIASASRGRFS